VGKIPLAYRQHATFYTENRIQATMLLLVAVGLCTPLLSDSQWRIVMAVALSNRYIHRHADAGAA
jgi:hypothetical protein